MASRIFRSNDFSLDRPNWSLRLRASCCVSVLAPCARRRSMTSVSRGDEDAPDVDAEMAIELRVLGGDDRLAQKRVDVVVADHHAPLCRELADHLAAGRVDARDRARRVVVERRHLRQIAGVGEEDAAQHAEHRGDDEERDDARVTGDANDDVWHGSRSAGC